MVVYNQYGRFGFNSPTHTSQRSQAFQPNENVCSDLADYEAFRGGTRANFAIYNTALAAYQRLCNTMPENSTERSTWINREAELRKILDEHRFGQAAYEEDVKIAVNIAHDYLPDPVAETLLTVSSGSHALVDGFVEGTQRAHKFAKAHPEMPFAFIRHFVSQAGQGIIDTPAAFQNGRALMQAAEENRDRLSLAEYYTYRGLGAVGVIQPLMLAVGLRGMPKLILFPGEIMPPPLAITPSGFTAAAGLPADLSAVGAMSLPGPLSILGGLTALSTGSGPNDSSKPRRPNETTPPIEEVPLERRDSTRTTQPSPAVPAVEADIPPPAPPRGPADLIGKDGIDPLDTVPIGRPAAKPGQSAHAPDSWREIDQGWSMPDLSSDSAGAQPTQVTQRPGLDLPHFDFEAQPGVSSTRPALPVDDITSGRFRREADTVIDGDALLEPIDDGTNQNLTSRAEESGILDADEAGAVMDEGPEQSQAVPASEAQTKFYNKADVNFLADDQFELVSDTGAESFSGAFEAVSNAALKPKPAIRAGVEPTHVGINRRGNAEVIELSDGSWYQGAEGKAVYQYFLDQGFDFKKIPHVRMGRKAQVEAPPVPAGLPVEPIATPEAVRPPSEIPPLPQLPRAAWRNPWVWGGLLAAGAGAAAAVNAIGNAKNEAWRKEYLKRKEEEAKRKAGK